MPIEREPVQTAVGTLYRMIALRLTGRKATNADGDARPEVLYKVHDGISCPDGPTD
jgi:hypothetical protein